MKHRRLLIWIASIGIGFLSLPSLTLLFIPDAVIQKSLGQALSATGIRFQANKTGTALPLGIKASSVILSDATAALIKLDQIDLQLNPLSLLFGKVAFRISAQSGTGAIRGTVVVAPLLQGDLQINNLDLTDIPLLASKAGGSIKGTARIGISYVSPSPSSTEGTIRLLVREIKLQGLRIGTIPLPDANFAELRAALKIKGQTVMVDNLALQGNGLYLRLNGFIPLKSTSPLNLNLELMPSSEFMVQQKSVFLFMALYQVSPGHYRVPITGTLAQLQLAR